MSNCLPINVYYTFLFMILYNLRVLCNFFKEKILLSQHRTCMKDVIHFVLVFRMFALYLLVYYRNIK